MPQTHWLPLQSSPEMLNGFAKAAGLPADSGFEFVDVWGLDDELLAMVPGEKLALTLLFDHTSEKLCAAKAAQADQLAAPPHNAAPADLFYVKQFVGNACGTIAATHVLANAAGCRATIPPDSALGAFYGACDAAGMTADERGVALGEAAAIHAVSESSAAGANGGGEDGAPELGAKVDFHFISFVQGSDGQVWELDGRKAGPVCHGACGEAGFLKAAVSAIKAAYMDVDPDAQMWNIMAFVKL